MNSNHNVGTMIPQSSTKISLQYQHEKEPIFGPSSLIMPIKRLKLLPEASPRRLQHAKKNKRISIEEIISTFVD